jgi:phage terminase large subunit-like protein
VLPPGVPDLTLGWELLDWGSTYLAQPDGVNAGDRWVYTVEQGRFVLWFYAIDKAGRFTFRRALIQRGKGWGKSPFLAALCSTELCGPVLFDGFDADGRPVGRPHPNPYVQLAAVSKAQTDNTMSLAIEMLGQGDAMDEYDIDIGKTRILCGTGRLEPVTASARSREGNRPTFCVLDESHLWTPQNHGKVLADTLRRNLGKVDGRSVETTNAFRPGEQSVAEDSHNYWRRIEVGEVRDPGFLYDHRQAPEGTPLTPGPERRAGLLAAYGDSAAENGGWVNLDRIEQEIDDPATSPDDARRFYLNQIVSTSSSWFEIERFRAAARAFVVSKREPIALGFDGSVRKDATALVACRLSDGFCWPLGVWERPLDAPSEWEVPFTEVDDVVRLTLDEWDVRWMFADPAYWQDIVGRWSTDYDGIVYEFWTHRRALMARAIERFETAVLNGQCTYSALDAHEALPRHVLNAVTEQSASGKLIRKEFPMSSRKIDCAMAAVLAYEARAAALASDEDDSDRELRSY